MNMYLFIFSESPPLMVHLMWARFYI